MGRRRTFIWPTSNPLLALLRNCKDLGLTRMTYSWLFGPPRVTRFTIVLKMNWRELLESLSQHPGLKVLLLPRSDAQRTGFGARTNFIMPQTPLDGSGNLIAAADLVISAGGTMNREAAALGVPAATIYAGKWAAIDEQLVIEGRLRRIASREDLQSLPLEKKGTVNARRARKVRGEVADLILEPGF